jgi:hypothetical protein
MDYESTTPNENVTIIGFEVANFSLISISAINAVFENCTFLDYINLRGESSDVVATFKNCTFAQNTQLEGQGFFEVNGCTFLDSAVLIITESVRVDLINNKSISVEQRDDTKVKAIGDNLFVAPNNSSEYYGYLFTTGSTVKSKITFLDGVVFNTWLNEPAYISISTPFLGKYSLGKLLFNTDTGTNKTLLPPQSPTDGILDALQLIDKQTFTNIAPSGKTQREINKAIDGFLSSVTSMGRDRGSVLSAFALTTYPSFPEGAVTFGNAGSGYTVGDVIFI